MTRPIVQDDMPNFVCEAWLEEEPAENLPFACGTSRHVYAWPAACSIRNAKTPDLLGSYATATVDWFDRAQRLGHSFLLGNLGKWPEAIRMHRVVTANTIRRTFGQDVVDQFSAAKVHW